jgi:hypothetical protein
VKEDLHLAMKAIVAEKVQKKKSIANLIWDGDDWSLH